MEGWRWRRGRGVRGERKGAEQKRGKKRWQRRRRRRKSLSRKRVQKIETLKIGAAKANKLTSPSVSTMSPRVTALAPSPAAATSEFPDDGEAEANRIVVVAVAAFAAAAFLAIGGSSLAHAAVDDDEEAADVEAVAPARMREAAWRSIVDGEGQRVRRERWEFG